MKNIADIELAREQASILYRRLLSVVNGVRYKGWCLKPVVQDNGTDYVLIEMKVTIISNL